MAGSFTGGIHPDDAKNLSKNCALEHIPLPASVVLPVSQHLGAPAKVIVEQGRTLKKGEMVAEPGGFVSIPIHASISGTVNRYKNVSDTIPRRTARIRKIISPGHMFV